MKRLLAEAASERYGLLPIFAGRFLRSLTQGYLAIIVPLYLLARGYSPSTIGLLVATGAGSSALIAIAIGTIADRVGRRPVLMAFGVLTAGAGAVFALRADFALLVVASALGTLGQGGGVGGGGAFGPYFVAEQALTAELAGDRRRTAVFASLSLVGALGSILGSVIAATPQLLLRVGFVGSAAFAPLFWLTAATGIAMALIIVPLREPSAQRIARLPHTPLSRGTWSIMFRLMLTNGTNGVAIGFLGPIMVLWFHVRYGVNEGELATLYAIINVLSIGSYLAVTRVVRAFGGAVRTVVGMRLLTCALLATLPFAPTFPIAGLLFACRLLLVIVAAPVRQSYVMGIIPPAERARAAAFSNVPSRLTQMIGPAVGGALIEHAWIDLPLTLAAVFQATNAGLYWKFFRTIAPPEERGARPHASSAETATR